MIDWNNIGVYGNYEPAPGDPVPPKIGDTEIRDGDTWCYLPKRDGTCTILKWYRLFLNWQGKHQAIDEKTGGFDLEVSKSIPAHVHPKPTLDIDETISSWDPSAVSDLIFKAPSSAKKIYIAKGRGGQGDGMNHQPIIIDEYIPDDASPSGPRP